MSSVVYKDTGLLFLRDNNAEATTLLQKFATKQAEKKVLLKKKGVFWSGWLVILGLFSLFTVGCKITERVEEIIFVSKISVTS